MESGTSISVQAKGTDLQMNKPPKKKRETATEQAMRVEEELMIKWKKEHQIEPPPKPDPCEALSAAEFEAFEEVVDHISRVVSLAGKRIGIAALNAAIKHAKGGG